jgi:O-antigen ligase
MIDGSLFFDNSNDLAIGLLLAAASLLFVFFTPNRLLKIVASAEITLCILYILKTGSRGTFLAAIVSAFFAVMFAKRRPLLLLLAPPVLIALLAVVPSQTLQRLQSIVVDPEQTLAEGKGSGDVESQLAREDMFKLSLKLTATHPLLGVGMGMFDDFVQGEAAKAGKHTASLNTHNAYTQISSECGIPAFVCYLMTIILTLKLNYRMYKAFSREPDKIDGRLVGIAFAGLIGGIGYVVASMFHHIAYSADLAWLAGDTLALWLCTQSLLTSVPGGRLKRTAS